MTVPRVTGGRATSFGSIADQYNRLRPSPPAEAVDWLLGRQTPAVRAADASPRPAVPANTELVVDLAAGTGLLSRAIPAGQVIAVEPDARMGAVLRANSPGVRVVAGVGEALPLADGSVDAVLISSAWHWLDPDRAVPEIARVLRAAGRFGLIWTSRDREVGWVREVDMLREPSSSGAGGPLTAPRPRYRNRDVTLPDGHSFTGIDTASFTFTRTIAVEDFAPMIGTYSRIITAGEQERADILARVQAAIEAEFPGATEIDLPMRSLCWRANKTGGADPEQ